MPLDVKVKEKIYHVLIYKITTFNKTNTNLYNKEEIVVEIGLQFVFLTFIIYAIVFVFVF